LDRNLRTTSIGDGAVTLPDGTIGGLTAPSRSRRLPVMSSSPSLFHVDRLELTFKPKPWAFAAERSADIDAFFTALRREKPAVWNGRVLVLYRYEVAGGVFRGEFLEADYAGFAAWVAWGWPAAAAYDCFAAAAVQSADGAFLLGRMSSHTANTGKIYFPSGTPDRSDLDGGKVDLDFSVRRELKEETGLDASQFSAEPGWNTVIDGRLIVHIKVFRARETAEVLHARILDQLARERQPEFSEILIARGPGDFNPMMPGFVTTFLAHRFASG
jgi:8-oxo-dGTP pyrophosphatase MutT (NUDIX family)